ncbi:Protein argonaute [Amphichorda felina]
MSDQGSKPPEGWNPGPGFDPARGPERKGNTRMELPPDAYMDGKKSEFTLRGNKLNTEGAPDVVHTNQYRMIKFDFSKKIYQYDVLISPDDRKLPFKKIMESDAVKKALAPYNHNMWMFDGKKLAWAPCKVDRGEIRTKVDLDVNKRPPDTPPKPGSVFHVTLRQTTEISLSVLQGYLEQKIEFSNKVMEALNFMDHLIRQGPSQKLLAIKRNFYNPSQKGTPLNDGRVVEVHKGLYASVRLSHNLAQGGIGLALNCDVTNTAFWVGGQCFDTLVLSFLAICDGRFAHLNPATSLGEALRPKRRPDGQFESSDAFKQLRKLRRLKFTVRHKNRTKTDKVFSVQDFMFGQNFGPDGATAQTVKFEYNGKKTSVADYYRQKYGVTLKYSRLPLIDAGKGGAIPLELAFLEPMQRFMFKLNPKQTEAMIKIAVTKPPVRRKDIEDKVGSLNLPNDPYLRYYGVEFERTFSQTQAKLLPAPGVDFRQGKQAPGFSGRWRLDQGNIKFWKPNRAPLKAWGIIAMDQCINDPSPLKAFVDKFKDTFIRHGGVCEAPAKVIQVPGNIQHNGAEAVAYAHQQIAKDRGYTQLLFIVVGHKNSPHYERLKKNADCRWGILSQVVVSNHVGAANGQYISNVCMKVNAKLGGSTARTASPFGKGPTYFPSTQNTMMIGVDVSHAAPGGNSASVAALTMNCDADANRFAAAVETNGYRTEMVAPKNMNAFMNKLTPIWRVGHKGAMPHHIIYFRDGVAEGQFSQVLDVEIAEIKRWFRGKNMTPKFTVIVATKRHHIRFFPGPDQRTKGGDQNSNPKPGLLVEKEVTHPFMWDFYLNSHKAIQGTARPVHYYVILDEMNCPANALQKMIYHQCYSYARSTTPVSLHPAIYYAHLAGSRARHHENAATSEGFRAGPKGHEMIRDKVAKGQNVGTSLKGVEAPELIELGGRLPKEGEVDNMPADEKRQRMFIKETMWYI